MGPEIDAETACYRGRFMEAVSAMEHRGIPLDLPSLESLKARWPLILEKLIAEVDRDYQVYEGTTFRWTNLDNMSPATVCNGQGLQRAV